ncbi:PepSY domain-containing protein [Belliella sp. DSM 111904]|uniref:PepSY domain-containing protein n=1 Tax=Belliella filtrata TaxID=2923435 RepID=A0ABS9V0M7_9BACT|nr:PepSY-associated TM helix domain-containing protein [Belliella filtrata]MCH7409770.1 PepSY domain-containing protein [Belliella filtrata]
MKEKKTLGLWPKIRKFFNDIHLWVGLASGIVLLAVCLTGTIYVYNTEIREWGAPHLYHVEVPKDAKKISAQEAIAAVKAEANGTITGITLEQKSDRPYQVSVRPEGNTGGRFGVTYFVNPYSGEILGNSSDPNKAADFMGYMFSLHRWLLLDKIEEPLIGELPNRTLGSYISGAATILFTIGVITGMVIWFPQRIKSWKQGLKVKFGKSWKRTNHDLHNTLAFYSIIILFLMGVTGPFWSFPWYREGLQKTLGTYQAPPAERTVGQGPPNGGGRGGSGGERERGQQQSNGEVTEEIPYTFASSIEELLLVVDETLPYKGNYRINIPQKGGDDISVQKSRVGFFAPAAGDRVNLDPVSKAVKEVEIFRDKPFNERVSRSVKALHVGDVYGQFSKLLYFIACLIATSLPVTGTLIWINKMKKGKKKTSSNKHVTPKMAESVS